MFHLQSIYKQQKFLESIKVPKYLPTLYDITYVFTKEQSIITLM